MNEFYIEDLKQGDKVKWYYLLKEKNIRTTRAGKYYLDITLEDKTGEISGKIWENAKKINSYLREGELIFIEAQVEIYKEKKQLNISKARKIFEQEISPFKIIPSAKEDIDKMWSKLNKIVKEKIKNPFMVKLIKGIFSKYEKKFKKWPGARKVHHSYIGGLLEHTLSVLEICLFLSNKYSLNADILLTGAILHDIGKIKEIDSSVNKAETEEGFLLGHILIGIDIIRSEAAKIIGFPKKILRELIHLIASHHGNYEFGAIREPLTREALMLHFADYIDSQINIFEDIMDKHEGKLFISDYDFRIGRKLFVGEKE